MPSFGRVQVSWSCTQVPDFGGGQCKRSLSSVPPHFKSPLDESVGYFISDLFAETKFG